MNKPTLSKCNLLYIGPGKKKTRSNIDQAKKKRDVNNVGKFCKYR